MLHLSSLLFPLPPSPSPFLFIKKKNTYSFLVTAFFLIGLCIKEGSFPFSNPPHVADGVHAPEPWALSPNGECRAPGVSLWSQRLWCNR